MDVLNNNGGHIGTGGNISVTTGGDLTAGSTDALIDNRNGGTIDSSANLTFNIGGALTTTGDASFGISNSNDGSGGGMIGSDAVINMTANNISIGGALFANIVNIGGSIVGSADINFNLTGDLTTQRVLNFSSRITAVLAPSAGARDLNFNLTGDLTTSGGRWILDR